MFVEFSVFFQFCLAKMVSYFVDPLFSYKIFRNTKVGKRFSGRTQTEDDMSEEKYRSVIFIHFVNFLFLFAFQK